MASVDCPFRLDVRATPAGEVATCGLVQQMTGAVDGAACEVERSACEVCVTGFPGRDTELNPVIPSLVYQACERQHRHGCSTSRTQSLLSWAGSVLASEDVSGHRPTASACDVLICCRDSSDRTRAAIQSAIEQDGCVPFLHLVDVGDGAAVLDTFRSTCNVRVWDLPGVNCPWRAAQQLLPRLQTPYLAIQDPATVSRRNRLAWGLSQLERRGAEFHAGSLEVAGRLLTSSVPDGRRFERLIQPQTLLMRRATLIDMGGFADRPDADVELLYRAARERRKIATDHVATVAATAVPSPRPVGGSPDYPFARILRQHAAGFEMSIPECDVVLPFRGEFDFVNAAMESLIAQQKADLLIHLIDDGSQADSTELLRYWAGRKNVRTYRNRQNIGPFASFNNASSFFETDYAAVQDGDDLSEPERIFWSCNSLRLSASDLFGAAMRLFGDESIQASLATETATEVAGVSEQVVRYRRSAFPDARVQHCFLQNPTLVVRTEAFRRLGGYADFGEPLRNRTGVDTEFQLRAACAGHAFSISHEPVVRYRCRADSATQHASTGMGSGPNREAAAERLRRLAVYRRSAFLPATFGALDRHAGITERL